MFTKSWFLTFLKICLGFTAILGIHSLFMRNIHNIEVKDIYTILRDIVSLREYNVDLETTTLGAYAYNNRLNSVRM